MESATLRAAYQMGSEVKGVLIRELSPTAPVAQVLKANDVITHFDGVQVSSDGTVPFRWAPEHSGCMRRLMLVQVGETQKGTWGVSSDSLVSYECGPLGVLPVLE